MIRYSCNLSDKGIAMVIGLIVKWLTTVASLASVIAELRLGYFT